MQPILDLEEKKEIKNSWKPVLITNGILFISMIIFCIWIFFSTSDSITFPVADMIGGSIMLLCFAIIGVNILALIVSLFFSKERWKNWLIMIVIGFVILALSVFIAFLVDLEKLDF